MNDCPNADVRDLLPDLVHERLGPAVRTIVEAHVEGCADCQAEVALLRALRVTLNRAPVVDIAAITSAIAPYRVATPVRVRRNSWVGWQAAAAITILAAGGSSVLLLRHGDTAVAPVRDSLIATTSVPAISAPVTPAAVTATHQASSAATANSSPSHTVTSVPSSGATPTPAPASQLAAMTPVAQTPSVTKAPPVVRERELAMSGGTMSDLSDSELAALLKDIDKMDAVPSTDVESGATTPSVPPRSPP
jgi:hypothetical protein